MEGEAVSDATEQVALLAAIAEVGRLRNEIARLNNQTNWVCACGGTDTEGQKENAALKAALDHQMNYQRELRADKDRLDWLDKTGCWLTIPGSRKGQKFFAGTARAVIDSEMGVAQ
jgi:hypothetical protein